MNAHEISPEKIAKAREWFVLHGIPLSEWADQHKVNRSILYAVLSGKSRCVRGESHRIAVLLGLKPKVLTDQSSGLESPVSPEAVVSISTPSTTEEAGHADFQSESAAAAQHLHV